MTNKISIKNTLLFKSFSDKQLTEILKKTEQIVFSKGDVIHKLNSTDSKGIYIVLKGEVTFFNHNTEYIDENIISISKENDTFNEHSIYYETKTSSTAIATKKTVALFISKEHFIALAQTDHNLKKQFYNSSSKTYQMKSAKSILKNIYGRHLDYKIIDGIINVGKVKYLKKNISLFKKGDESDSVYFLISGLLKVFVPDGDDQKLVGEVHKGEVIGEMGIISNQPRSASAYASRDSILFEIDKNDFNSILIDNPTLILKITNQIINRLAIQQNTKKHSRTNIFTFANLSKYDKQDINQKKINSTIIESLNKLSSVFFLDSRVASDMLNINDINSELELDEIYSPLDELIAKLSDDSRYIILCCDNTLSPWSKWCIKLGEKLIYMVNSDIGLNNREYIKEIKKIESDLPKHLIQEKQLFIYHNSRESIPYNTIKIIESAGDIDMHYHIALDNKNDFDRFARFLIGRNIGLCLAGGGAKGNAHIGVYKALIENNIPIDSVCGTSAGGIVASLIASGYDVNEIISILKESYARKVFKEYTIPYSSLIATIKVDKDAKLLAAGKNVEDLWLPMFTCAVNITTSKLEVIDRGPLWVATRATAALPGILLPIIRGNSFLVDGGLINNMPGDILLKKFGGKLISVSVSPEEDMAAKLDQFPPQFSYFFKQLFKSKSKKKESSVPNLGSILMRSILVGSSAKSREVENISDLFLNPKIDNVGMLEFDSIDESVEIGYKYTMDYLEKHDFSNLF